MFTISVNRANRATRAKSGKQDQANHSVQTLVFFICFNIYRIARQKEKITSVRIMAFIARAIPFFSRTPLYATNVIQMSYGPTSSLYNPCDATLLYLRELAPN
jgi:hypothetical protein